MFPQMAQIPYSAYLMKNCLLRTKNSIVRAKLKGKHFCFSIHLLSKPFSSFLINFNAIGQEESIQRLGFHQSKMRKFGAKNTFAIIFIPDIKKKNKLNANVDD